MSEEPGGRDDQPISIAEASRRILEIERSLLRSWIDKVIRFCLQNKLVVGLVVLAIIGWGILVAPFNWDLGGLPRNPVPVDAIPDIGENQQVVFTEWMGRSPQDVEDQITYPLTVSLLGLPKVKTVRSYSFFGFSTIYVIFREEAEFYWSRSRVLEKLNSLPAGTLPEGVQPALGPDATSLGQIFWYTLEGRDPDDRPIGGWDLHELRTIQDWNVRYGLLSAVGISEVASVGGFVQEYQVDVDPDAMRAHRVTLAEVFRAVKASNVDVGARTIEVNKVEYVIRGLGFIKELSDLENSVIKVNENVPIYLKNVGTVSLGPALRRGALDKDGAEAVGGVVVVRYGFNPMAAIENVKKKIEKIAPALPIKALIDFKQTTRAQAEAFAEARGFHAFKDEKVDDEAWLKALRSMPRENWPSWVTTSQVTIVPFYDRTGLIQETLGTLNTALTEEILVTIIVVIVSVFHLRSSILISGVLPLAVLMCFIGMKGVGVDANIVALSGIAIAIGTIVDMGIIVCENVLKHLDEAGPDENRLEVIFRATSEVGSAVLTAVATTVISFLPVFTMTAAEGKLFKPLAFTKTFALVASVIVALTIIPPAAHLLLAKKVNSRRWWQLFSSGLILAGIIVGGWLAWWAGAILVALGTYHLCARYLPPPIRRAGPWIASGVAVLCVGVILARHWLPLGPEKGLVRNFIFVGLLIGGLLGFFRLFQRFYGPILRWCLVHKLTFLALPTLVVLFGGYVWLGPRAVWGPVEKVSASVFAGREDIEKLVERRLLEERGRTLLWTNVALGMSPDEMTERLNDLEVTDRETVHRVWLRTKEFAALRTTPWGKPDDPKAIRYQSLRARARWTLAQDWNGLGKEFMPPLDEGSFLYMPTTMPHASIGEALDVLQKQDRAFRAVPEIDSVVGKIGRAETPLDPAPISMVETVINYKPEYKIDEDGRRLNYRYDDAAGDFVRGEDGDLIPDPNGRPYRNWRPHIKSPNHIWKEIVRAGELPGSTSAPKLQPIAARIVMLQSGMRAPMGVKIKATGTDLLRVLKTIERVGLQIERFLKEVPSVDPPTVIADRIVGKPYIEIDIDRKAIARYGMKVRQVQDVIEVAIGGRRITTTVEGRERYPVRVRYLRELRDQIETLGRILVPAPDGKQIPLTQLAQLRYVRGPQAVKSEDTFLVGYVLFDMKPGYSEVDVVEECALYLEQKEKSGEFIRPKGVTYEFAGSYENQVRSQKTLLLVLPVALLLIFIILYFQFQSVPTTLLVFIGIIVAWAGGFLLIWGYNQPWFLDFSLFGTNMRELFQMPTLDLDTGELIGKINLSVAVWVGFLALFGIASDNGVVIATYLNQSFRSSARGPDKRITSVSDIRAATVEGALRRIRPCLMTSATTILALIPVLTSTGRGSDMMVPMAIPSFGGMLVVLISVFVVPVLYCLVKEFRQHSGISDGALGLLLVLTLFLAVIPMAIYCTVKGARREEGPAADQSGRA